ncbi:hypothetical protein L7F22_061036 [Adiantum nelumboides]|nr:hypothetical protein [Adiantum nelumboides]
MGDDDTSPLVQSPSFQRNNSMERITSQPEDQSAMTIEFLRARLLAERSISKAAHQRAQQLASKVTELEQRVKLEASMRQMSEELRQEVLFKHKEELMEDCGYLFTDRVSYDDHTTSQQESLGHSEHRCDIAEGFTSAETVTASEGHVSNFDGQGEDGDKEDDDNTDQLASEKGILAWASRKGKQRLLIKEWALSPTHLNRSFSPRSLGSLSPESDSPQKRWVGKSVRQIRTRAFNLNLDHGEITHDQVTELLHSNHCEDEVQKMLVHETECAEEIQSEESTQQLSEGFQEHSFLENDNKHKIISPSDARQEEDDDISEVQVPKEESRHGKPESADVGDYKNHQVAETNETWTRSYDDATCSVVKSAEVNYECNAIVPDLENVNHHVSKHLCSEDAKFEKKDSISVTPVHTPKKDNPDKSSEDGQEEQTDVIATYIFGHSSRNELTYAPSNVDTLDVETPASDLQKENYYLNLKDQFDSDKAWQSKSHVSAANLNFYASSLSSSQGSSSTLDGFPYQKKDLLSDYANKHQDFSEGMSRN